jgi:predicted  nucleic acid-binding Zn-ribbon protein
MGIQTIYT